MLIQIKTEEQLKKENSWNKLTDTPNIWNPKGKMDYLMGKEVDAVLTGIFWEVPTEDNELRKFWSIPISHVVTETTDADTN